MEILSAAVALVLLPLGVSAERRLIASTAPGAPVPPVAPPVMALASAPAQLPSTIPATVPDPATVVNPYKSRFEISGFNNSVNNNFGQWYGVGLHLNLEPTRRFGFLVETLRQWRPDDSEQLNALSVRTEWSDWFTTHLAVSGGGDDSPNAFLPRVRYDATGILKTPVPGLLLTGGYTRLYYGRPVSGRIARAGAILYAGPVIFQGTAFFNNVRPGNRQSLSGSFSAQYGREGSYWVGLTAGGGNEAWQTQGVVAQNVEFTGYNLSLFSRKWLTSNFGIVATYNYSIRKTAYRYNGVEFRLFFEF